MSSLRRGDGDLHHEDGSHRTTPPTTSGRALASHEARIQAHLRHHDVEDRIDTYARALYDVRSMRPTPMTDEEWAQRKVKFPSTIRVLRMDAEKMIAEDGEFDEATS